MHNCGTRVPELFYVPMLSAKGMIQTAILTNEILTSPPPLTKRHFHISKFKTPNLTQENEKFLRFKNADSAPTAYMISIITFLTLPPAPKDIFMLETSGLKHSRQPSLPRLSLSSLIDLNFRINHQLLPLILCGESKTHTLI